MKTLILLLALFSVSAQADEWREADTYREIAYLTVHSLDWMQTHTIAANPDKYAELNLILGRHPDAVSVNTYFALAALAHVGIAYSLPSEWRKAFQYVTIGMELRSVLNNFSLGIMITF